MGDGVNAAAFLEQGRYADVLGLIGQPTAADAATLVVAVRCRLEPGYVRAALDLVRGAPAAVASASEAGTMLRLWAAFLLLYDTDDRPFAERAAVFAGLCESLAAGADATVAALADDLRTRSDVLRFVLSGLGPEQRGGHVRAGILAGRRGTRA